MPLKAFYHRLPSGHLACVVCQGADGRHDAACALVSLRVQVQELTGALARCVAAMRETLDAVEELLCEKDAG
jgi:hypothetical protein